MRIPQRTAGLPTAGTGDCGACPSGQAPSASSKTHRAYAPGALYTGDFLTASSISSGVISTVVFVVAAPVAETVTDSAATDVLSGKSAMTYSRSFSPLSARYSGRVTGAFACRAQEAGQGLVGWSSPERDGRTAGSRLLEYQA